MINTNPGAELTVITYTAPCHVYGMREQRGVLVEMKTVDGYDIARVMRLDKTGDFSGIITTIPQKHVLYIDAATINDDHELVIN